MLEYRCPKCNQLFVTFKVLCNHAQSCHSIGYLVRESLNTSLTNVPINDFGLSPSDSKQLDQDKSPNSKIISEIRDSFSRINYLRQRVSFSPSVTFTDKSLIDTSHSPLKEKNRFLIEKDSSPTSTIPKQINPTQPQLQASLKSSHSHRTIYEIVFYYLDTFTLWKCRSVCQMWRRLAEMPQYWSKLKLTSCFLNLKFLETVSGWCQILSSLTLEDIDVKNVHEKGAMEKPLESILRTSQTNLTSVSVINCGVHLTERTLWLVSCHCPLLEEFAYISNTYPASPEAIWSLGAGCRRLNTLIIPPVFPSNNSHKFSDHCLSIIGKCWIELKILCIGGTSVTLKGLVAIAQRCQNLEVLELDHMGEIEESAVPPLCQAGLANLRALYFTHTPITPQALLQLKYFCKHLHKIKVLVSADDYFVQPDYPDNKVEYDKKIISLQNLRLYRGMEDVLTVFDLS